MTPVGRGNDSSAALTRLTITQHQQAGFARGQCCHSGCWFPASLLPTCTCCQQGDQVPVDPGAIVGGGPSTMTLYTRSHLGHARVATLAPAGCPEG